MKKIIPFLALVICFGAAKAQNNPIIADHTIVSQFGAIPDSLIGKAIPLRLMFRHASIGFPISNGLDCLQGTRNRCKEFPQYKYDRRNWIFQGRGNSGWFGKVDDFVAEVEKQFDSFDIFSFKYCYLDGLDGVSNCAKPTDVQKSWDYLRSNMDMLESKYPSKKFIWWTVPLTQSGQQCTDTLNSLIRKYTREKGKLLIDIADIECWDTTGKHLTNSNGWEVAFSGYCGEKPPGPSCHPNDSGSYMLAKAIWWMMTKIAAAEPALVLNKKNSEMQLAIYPNPAQDIVSIITAADEINVSIKIYTIYGKLTAEAVNTGKIDVSTLPEGLYLLRISTGLLTFNRKLIIRR